MQVRNRLHLSNRGCRFQKKEFRNRYYSNCDFLIRNINMTKAFIHPKLVVVIYCPGHIVASSVSVHASEFIPGFVT